MTIKLKDNSDEVIKQLGDNLEKALIEIGFFIEGEAKLRCPVDTDLLRSSIDNSVNVKQKYVAIGTNVKYGPDVELGTSRQKAQPFLKPAALQNEANIRIIIESNYKE